jgi:hypothetical protein
VDKIISATSRRRSLPKKISAPTDKVGEPNVPRPAGRWLIERLVTLSADREGIA